MSDEETQGRSERQEGSASTEPKLYRKNFRFSETQYADLMRIMEATGIDNETEATGFAYRVASRHVLPQLTTATSPTSTMLKDIQGFTGIILAFFREAERTLRGEGEGDLAVQTLGTEVIQSLYDPFLLAELFSESIGGVAPVWLRFSWDAPHLYKEGETCLERALEHVPQSRYSLVPRGAPEETLFADEEEERESDEGRKDQQNRACDPESDEEYASIRLYYPDMYALYKEYVSYLEADEKAAFFQGLQRSLKTLLPHLGKKQRQRKERPDAHA